MNFLQQKLKKLMPRLVKIDLRKTLQAHLLFDRFSSTSRKAKELFVSGSGVNLIELCLLFRYVRSKGSGSGTMYSLPKLHKTDFAYKFQYRSILAAYNQASFKISKFLVPILAPLTANKYTVTNSKDFACIFPNQQNAKDYYMSSFDVKSLFTSTPFKKLYKSSKTNYSSLTNLSKASLEIYSLNSSKTLYSTRFYSFPASNISKLKV